MAFAHATAYLAVETVNVGQNPVFAGRITSLHGGTSLRQQHNHSRVLIAFAPNRINGPGAPRKAFLSVVRKGSHRQSSVLDISSILKPYME